MTRWVAGLVLGALDGFLLFEFPLLGVALVTAGVILLARQPKGVSGLGGLLIGLGGLWVGVLVNGKLSCEAFNAVPGQSCDMPMGDAYLVVGGLVLCIGIGLTALALRPVRGS